MIPVGHSCGRASAATSSYSKQDSAGRHLRLAVRPCRPPATRKVWLHLWSCGRWRRPCPGWPTASRGVLLRWRRGCGRWRPGVRGSRVRGRRRTVRPKNAPYELGRARTELARALTELGRRDLARREAADALVILERASERAPEACSAGTRQLHAKVGRLPPHAPRAPGPTDRAGNAGRR